MKIVAIVAILGVSSSFAEAGQARRAPQRRAAPAAAAAASQSDDRVGQAYEQFLRARMIREDDVEGAIAAYKRAMALDPSAADIPADLADLYMDEGRMSEAIATAEQALKITPANYAAHRVLGMIYAQMATTSPNGRRGGGSAPPADAMPNAISHLEQSIENPPTFGDFTSRAVLARLYVASGKYDKAIATLPDLVKIGWQDGAPLLMEAYAGAGRAAEGIKWLEDSAPDNPELYGTLGDFYARARRWSDSATAYEQALENAPRSFDYRVFMASSLLQTDNLADVNKAREVLREAVTMRGTDERALYLLSQAERRSGDASNAEGAARRLIVQNGRNPRGYVALAEALEDQRRYQPIIDALAPAVTSFSNANDNGFALTMILPHLGFAYQELGQFDKAISTFETARKIAPNDPSVTLYLIQAQLAGKYYNNAAELAHAARATHPDDLRLARMESLALRRGGKVDQGLAILEDIARTHNDDPEALVALAQAYVDTNRAPQAVKLLQDAQTRMPGEATIALELGAVFDKQKKFNDAESVLRQLIAREPNNAIALNYLGYMLAERGERLGESVDYLKRALAIDPENGSYLDSIGWAYFKDGKFDLALDNLKKAADQLTTNSVVQDHYGEILYRLGRYNDAILAWTRALAGDGDSVDKADLDKKIRSARQKLSKR
jgi:tetratricopeptide (TPR) repeat protein